MLHDRPSDRVDPVLLLLLRVRDEVHGLGPSGELERELLVEHVLGALDGEAGGHGDDAARRGAAGDDGFLEPEEFSLFEDEPAAAPRLDVLALLGQPAGPLGGGPELDTAAVGGGAAHRGSPEARHGK